MDHISIIATELSLRPQQVASTISLLDEGATVPFISRYRKERTGSLDDMAVTTIRDRSQQLRDLDKRREAILKSIKEQEKLTPELEKAILSAETMTKLEDLYLPYKPKRKTKASIAREKGLEPLATEIVKQHEIDPEQAARAFVDEEKEVHNVEDALQGARDIIAEQINENADIRSKLRDLFKREGVISSKLIKGKEQEAAKYKDYFDWQEPISKIPSHRLLAIRRGEKEMFLLVDISPDEDGAINAIEQEMIRANNKAADQVKIAVKDAYKRLLKPSIETEIRLDSKKGADVDAIGVFAENLKQLLMAAPLGEKNLMAIDPGFRTGCKVVCLDRQANLQEFAAVFPNEPQKDVYGSGETIKHLIEKHRIEAIAIGNGTAGRETEQFIKSLGLPATVMVAMVNESGASVYSASEVAREEFPNEDVTVRGAVSIGRRLMDPLAELVKIDPKSIGVGQYQHDVDQNALRQSLDDVVMNCVNAVGVELNTASRQLLTYVSGLGPQLAENIVKHREENGPFKSRAALKKVARLGDKAYEQAAGFLRIRNGKNELDQSAVHPERYKTVEQMASDLGCEVRDLMSRSDMRNRIELKNYVSEEVGLPTLKDILDELDKPGRDPRDKYEVFSFADGVNDMSDLKTGMELPGIVTNITKFGAFVDVGVHQDGLVHISHLSDSFVSDPAAVVKLQQKVKVTVTEVDPARKRISLSMKSDPFGKTLQKSKKPRQERSRNRPDADGDLQAKLAMLKGKFGK
ncbi:MAG: RNA-binding transcriptional accessory protein [Cyclobacteriaceae bacterium]|nr:RNA-binding transcriptional accessory protein [Cyclobacteriaceae bacterium HetDA_MAG_MS6]